MEADTTSSVVVMEAVGEGGRVGEERGRRGGGVKQEIQGGEEGEEKGA